MAIFGSMKNTDWALRHVEARLPSGRFEPAAALQQLIHAFQALAGRADAQVFGLAADNIERRGVRKLQRAIVKGLVSWKHALTAGGQRAWLLELDAVGRTLELEELLLEQRFPLRCDPLGGLEGLADAWVERLRCLEEAIAGRRQVDRDAVRLIFDEDAPPTPEVGEPDQDALYRFALQFEEEHDQEFPRELAAVWSRANGVSFDDDPFLRPVVDWTWLDEGLCIGCGHYLQGSLVIHPARDHVLGGPIVDCDDDWVEAARYEDLGALVDALLAIASVGG